MINEALCKCIAQRTADKNILLIGARGNVGNRALRLLLHCGTASSITAFDKKPPPDTGLPAQVIIRTGPAGDITDFDAVREATAGKDTVVCAVGVPRRSPSGEKKPSPYDIEENGMENIVQASRRSGAGHIIYISVLGAALGDGIPPFHHGCRAKRNAEQVLIGSGIAYTIIRPTGYFNDYREILYRAMAGTYRIVNDGSARAQPIDEQNVAEMLIASIGNGRARNSIIAAGGPEAFTKKQFADVFGRLLHETVTPLSMTPEQYKKAVFNSDLLLFRALSDSVLSDAEMETLRRVYPEIRLRCLEDYLNSLNDPRLQDYFKNKEENNGQL